MRDIDIAIKEDGLDFQLVRDMTFAMAKKFNSDTMLVAWYDRKTDRRSPHLDYKEYECSSPEYEHWEKYGRNHGGQLKVTVNSGEYVMIYT